MICAHNLSPHLELLRNDTFTDFEKKLTHIKMLSERVVHGLIHGLFCGSSLGCAQRNTFTTVCTTSFSTWHEACTRKMAIRSRNKCNEQDLSRTTLDARRGTSHQAQCHMYDSNFRCLQTEQCHASADILLYLARRLKTHGSNSFTDLSAT